MTRKLHQNLLSHQLT